MFDRVATTRGAFSLRLRMRKGVMFMFHSQGRTYVLSPYRLSTTLLSRIYLNLRNPDLYGGPRRMGRWTLTGASSELEDVSGRMSFCPNTGVRERSEEETRTGHLDPRDADVEFEMEIRTVPRAAR